MKRAFFFFYKWAFLFSIYCIFVCVTKLRHSKAIGFIKDNIVLSPARWALEKMVFELFLDLKG